RVGEANVAARMREVGAVIGGEGNGGVMLPELHATRDAPLAAALVMQLLAERRQSLGRIVAERPRYAIAKRKVDRPEMPLESVYTRLENESESVPEVDHQDGLRLSWPARGAWLHVRPSGTEPIVRVIAEARNAAEARSLADWAVELVNG
ncbi:MAG: phosphoglucosamine mutase, partial [Gemmatimonadota bacterium]